MTRILPRFDALQPAVAAAGASGARTAPSAENAPVTRWSRQVVGRLVLADSLSACAAVAVGFAVRVGFSTGQDVASYLVWSLGITLAWLFSLHVKGSYEVRRITTGTREYQRVVRAGASLAGMVAIVCYLSGAIVGRTFVVIVIPSGALLMLVSRYVLRKAIYRHRRSGQWSSTILAVGTSESVQHLAEVTGRVPEAGLIVVGACVEDAGDGDELLPGVPVVGDVLHTAAVAEELDVDIVAVAGTGLGPRRIRELGWALEGTGRNMVMAPGLTEVAGPRVHVSPVEGLPLMWVDQPQFTGVRRVIKRAVDVLGAAMLLTLTAPALLLIALAVRLSSRGPVLYRSIRTGQDGRAFCAWKFRSMYPDADQRRPDLLAHNEYPDGLLFKIREDPRVTPIGRVLRKYSLDELPQLFNVLCGSMSLVGPRPPLPDEVRRYRSDLHRRLLVKPGMTGLWQVSGRSDLPWDESVRLDLYYVENWSLTLDLAIIAKTVWAVLRSRGAY